MSASLSSVMEVEKKSARSPAKAGTTNLVALRRVFCVRLSLVRARLAGLSREDERRLRREHLQEGVDWHEFGNGLCYSEVGVALLERVLAEGNSSRGGAENAERKEILDTGGQASLDETGISADRRSASATITVPTEAAQPVKSRPRVLGLLAERTGELKGAAFQVRTMRCHFPNSQVIEVKIESLGGNGSRGGVPSESGQAQGAETRGFMRVRASEHFLPGMLCWARVERGESCWVFMGRGDMEATEAPVCPRSRGRW